MELILYGLKGRLVLDLDYEEIFHSLLDFKYISALKPNDSLYGIWEYLQQHDDYAGAIAALQIYAIEGTD